MTKISFRCSKCGYFLCRCKLRKALKELKKSRRAYKRTCREYSKEGYEEELKKLKVI